MPTLRYLLGLLIIVLCIQLGNAEPTTNSSANKTQNANTESQVVTTNTAVQTKDEANAETDRYRKERDAKDDAFRAQAAQQNEIIKDANRWMAFSAIASAVFAIILTFVSIFQWRQTRHLFDLAERPSISVVDISPHQEGDSTGFRLQLRNSGRIPARNLETKCTRTYTSPEQWDNPRECPEPPEPLKWEGQLSRPVLGVNSEISAFSPTITSTELQSLTDGKHYLFIWIRVTYEGFNSKKRYFFEAYYRWNRLTGGFDACQCNNDAN